MPPPVAGDGAAGQWSQDEPPDELEAEFGIRAGREVGAYVAAASSTG